MMEDAKKGIINGIIVKDLSRLGRNYIEMGTDIPGYEYSLYSDQ